MRAELLFFTVSSGLFAAFSPCSLPAYPVLLNLITRGEKSRRASAVAFAAGVACMFTLFYVGVGFALKLIGETVFESLDSAYIIIYCLAAVLCFLFALQSLGLVRLYVGVHGPRDMVYGGVPGAFLTGAFFGTVISPCNLPFILTGILPVLLAKTTVADGLLLMLAFGVSLSLPMLLLGVFSGYALDAWLRRHVRTIELASTAFLIVAALYFSFLVLDSLTQ